MNKVQLHPSWTEITAEKAKELFKIHQVFAYDESQEVEWLLETRGDLMDAIRNNNILFIENDSL